MSARIGVVLGGGGTVGYGWHTGIMRGLAEVAGFDAREATELVGTSAGSYAVAYLRGGLSGSDLYALAVGEDVSAEGAQLVASAGTTGPLDAPMTASFRPASPGVLLGALRARSKPRIGTVMAGLLPVGSVSPEPYLAPLRRLFADGRWPAGLLIPAVRLSDGVRVVFGSDSGVSVPDAVAASSAVPGYMEGVEINGERYTDGSTHAPTNADVLTGAGLDLVIVSAPMSPPPEGPALSRDLPVRAWAARHLRQEVLALTRVGTRVIVVSPTKESRARMARSGMSEAVRAPAAAAGYQQVLEHGAALRQQLG